jgi:transposase
MLDFDIRLPFLPAMEGWFVQVLYTRCCGMDVHKATVVVCVITPDGKEIRTFGTMTSDLLEMADWLKELGITHIAMESTGVYWKPIYNILEDYDFKLLVVNAQHIKAVPGRKTDVKDAEWIADLLRHGLLQGSRIPDRGQRELRELTRYRKSLIRERSNEVNRLQKVLEGANIKLSSVASDVVGRSGRMILRAIISGQTDPVLLANLAQGRLKDKIPQLRLALRGRIGLHQRQLLSIQLKHIDFIEEQIDELSREIERRMLPFKDPLERVATIPGVGKRTAEMVLAEMGTDMADFPSAAHLASWAGLCPGNNESAGKRKTGRTRRGSPWLREALTEAARAAARTKNTFLSSQYRRIAARRGSNRAAVAVAHTILVIIYHILKTANLKYQELGPQYQALRNNEAATKRAVKQLTALGYKVTLEATA